METQTNTPLVFSGEYCHALDPKNRVSVPSCWKLKPRDGHEPIELFLVPDPGTGEFLLIFPKEEFEAVAQRVEASNIPPKDKRIFIRQFYSQAKRGSVDKQGRLLLPEDFCSQLDLRGEVVLAGTVARFEIWNPGRWESNKAAVSGTYTSVADQVGV